MQKIAELERRITAALERIGAGLDDLRSGQPAAAAGGGAPGPVPLSVPPAQPTSGQEALLRAELDEERMRNAQLSERIKVMTARETALREARPAEPKPAEPKPVHVPVAQAQLEARIDKMTRQLDVQGLELQRMRKVTIQLREQLARLREAAEEGTTEPHLINKAMMAELDALRATRASEIAEMDEILAELSPMIGEEATHA